VWLSIIGRVGSRIRLKQNSTVVTVFFVACGIVFAVLDPAPVRANDVCASIRPAVTSLPSLDRCSGPDFVCSDAPSQVAPITCGNQHSAGGAPLGSFGARSRNPLIGRGPKSPRFERRTEFYNLFKNAQFAAAGIVPTSAIEPSSDENSLRILLVKFSWRRSFTS
jgi:hypothetical protein